MKQAVAALGELEYLATKTSGEDHARLVKEFRFGDIEVFHVPYEGESGTEIAVTELSNIVTTDPGSYTRSLVPELGARYRRFLKPENRQLNLRLEIRDFEHPETANYSWDVQEVKPTYLHPSTRDNRPTILSHR